MRGNTHPFSFNNNKKAAINYDPVRGCGQCKLSASSTTARVIGTKAG
jgi:hypothetical protein